MRSATGSLAGRAYGDVRRMVAEGALEPGERLNVRVVGERLRLFATPVKAALASLARDGFVTAAPKRGYVVTVLHQRDVQELFGLREALEMHAVRLGVTQRVDPRRRKVP